MSPSTHQYRQTTYMYVCGGMAARRCRVDRVGDRVRDHVRDRVGSGGRDDLRGVVLVAGWGNGMCCVEFVGEGTME